MNDMTDFWLGADEQDMMPRGGRSRFNRDIDRRMALRELGRNVCFGKGGGSAPSPDPAIGQAAMKNAEIGEEWLTFAREQFTEGNKRLEVMDTLTNKVIQQQLDTQDQANEWAQEDRTRTKDVFQPLEDEFIETAKNYDSAENQDRAAAEASADMQKAADTQRAVNQRSMASMGISPNSGRFAGVSRADTTNAALATAGASNAARTQVRDKGMALKADAINIGRNLPSSTAAAYGIGLNAGNSAVGNQGASDAGFYKNVGVMGQGFGGAMQGYNNQGSILNNLYGNQVNAWSAQQQANSSSAAGIGQLAGTAMTTGAVLF